MKKIYQTPLTTLFRLMPTKIMMFFHVDLTSGKKKKNSIFPFLNTYQGGTLARNVPPCFFII